MTIQEKYQAIRSELRHGDFILFSGTGIVASVIKEADNSEFSHIGRVVKLEDRWLIIDSNAPGNHPEWLSSRVEGYNPDSNFVIIRSNKAQPAIDSNVRSFVSRSDDERTKYDFKNGIKELLNRAFGFKFKIKLDKKHQICSMSVRKDYQDLNMCTIEFVEKVMTLPEDFVRYRNEQTTYLLFVK